MNWNSYLKQEQLENSNCIFLVVEINKYYIMGTEKAETPSKLPKKYIYVQMHLEKGLGLVVFWFGRYVDNLSILL